jgi:hypothetical protein
MQAPILFAKKVSAIRENPRAYTQIEV